MRTGVKLAVGALFVVAALGLAGVAQSLVIKGSTTVLPIAQLIAEEFAAIHPAAVISVQGGGSGTGIAALIDRTTHIAISSRAMKPSEWAKAVANKVYPYHWFVANDAIAVVVHPTNPISRITFAQLRAIYTGEIRNWKDLGGRDQPIVVVSRDTASGTFESFKELVLENKEVTAPAALFQPSNGAVAETVGRTPGAIGYIGLGYLNPTLKALPVARDAAGPFVEATRDTVVAGIYPIARPLFMITDGFPTGLVLEFIMFVLSDQGQRTVEEAGFVAIRRIGG
ncbi:phosphate ABC transporter substrate-binding protein [Candidatus Bipolaricaulota bacterium]|nr:phosphate ABC transporter substrate-binding protein [Candidatus Bipolaricaulota bacterium]